MGVLSASSSCLLLQRTSTALSSSVLHVAINVRPPSITTSHHLPGSNATVFNPSPFPIPNSLKSSATQTSHSISLHPLPRRPGFSRVPTMIRMGNLRLSIRRGSLAHNNLLVRKVVSILSQPVRQRTGWYESIRWSRDLHQAPRIRRNILWCAARSFW